MSLGLVRPMMTNNFKTAAARARSVRFIVALKTIGIIVHAGR
jgi:hypothetical protein